MNETPRGDNPNGEESTKLARELGLGAALSIGIGTMICAGIFVLPGIAAAKAGPVVVLSFASLLEGSVLTETVFAWPGLGRYLTSALLAADMNAVLGGTIVVGCIFVGVNLLSDVLYKIVDPRAR